MPHGELRYHHDFASKFLGTRRTLVVYLPPGYAAETRRRYPVVYLQDGQNLFDPATAAYGVAWEADATAERLIRTGRIPPLILVGLYNTPERISEYTFHRDAQQDAGGRGELYARFVLDEVKSFIDRTYRTKTDRKSTAIVGSSLGGLATLTMAHAHHDRFALCAALSPSLWWAGGRILKDFETDTAWMRQMRFWVDMGTREGSRRTVLHPGLLRLRKLVERFDAAGLLPGRDYFFWEVAGGEHNEANWAARFDKVLLFFFGDLVKSKGRRTPTLW